MPSATNKLQTAAKQPKMINASVGLDEKITTSVSPRSGIQLAAVPSLYYLGLPGPVMLVTRRLTLPINPLCKFSIHIFDVSFWHGC